MVASSRRVLPVFVFVHCFALYLTEWNTNDFQRREHSLTKPYQGSLWDPVGHAMITNNFIRLTSDHQSQRGAIWNSVPVYALDWELHVQFKVHGGSNSLFGDGMSIWYTRDRSETGPVFGNKDFFQGLAVFLDTYSNHNGPHNHGHPYISAMVNNGSLHYDHDRDGTHTELAGCEAAFRNQEHDTYLAIRYSYNKLTVSTDIEGKNSWKECFSVKGIHLPTGYYIGMSGGTGELADNHDILSVKFYELEVERRQDDTDYSKIVPGADFMSSPRDHIDDPKGAFMSGMLSGWRLFVVIILILIGIAVCLVVGVVVFQKNQHSSKRFY